MRGRRGYLVFSFFIQIEVNEKFHSEAEQFDAANPVGQHNAVEAQEFGRQPLVFDHIAVAWAQQAVQTYVAVYACSGAEVFVAHECYSGFEGKGSAP